MKYPYIFNKLNLLFKFASLEDEIAKLSTSKEIIDFLLKIQDSKLKGQAFNFVKTKNPNSAQEVELFLNSIIEKDKKIKELKENTLKSKESAIPDELKNIYNSITYPKLKQLILFKIEQKEITNSNNLQEKLDKISHYLQEVKRDSSIDELKKYSLDDIYKAAVEWEKLFKANVKDIALDNSKIVYGPTWKNPDFNGYFIYQLTTEEELKKEGSDLNHCVGGYFDKVKNNNCKIFSLRNSLNKAVLTIETSPDLFRFIQVFGYSNAQPTSVQASIINEWKQSLHSKDKIIQLSKGNEQQKISSAEFMDYKDPDYKVIIDKFIENEISSNREFLGTYENNALDVLQALASNETLDPTCYNKIYEKTKENDSTIHNLVRNKNISNNLFLKILNDNNYKNSIINIMASSFKLKEDIIYNEVIKVINKFDNIDTIKILLNNPSVSSSKVKELINKLSAEQIEEILNKVENLEPKFIKDLLSSDKIDKRHYIRILVENNLSQEIMAEIARKFDIKLLTYNKEDLLELLLDKEVPIEYKCINAKLTDEELNMLLQKKNIRINIVLSLNPNLTSGQIDLLLDKNNNNINANLAKNIDLNSNQINILLKRNSYECNRNLALKSKLTNEQFNILLNKNNDDIIYNLSQNKNLTAEQINILLNKDDDDINENLVKNPNLTNEKFNIFLNKNDDFINKNLAANQSLTVEQINILLNKNNDNINRNLTQNKNLTNEQINILLNKNDDGINYYLTINPNLTAKQFDILLNKNDYDYGLAQNKNLTSEQINILLNKNDDNINFHLSQNKNLTAEQINILLNKDVSSINNNLALIADLTNQQFNMLLNKNDDNINENLSRNSKLTIEQINILLNINDNYDINYNLAKNPNLTKKQTIKLLEYGPITLTKYFGNNAKNAMLLKNIYQLNKIAKVLVYI